MKFQTPEISWHERDPIFSVDIQLSSQCDSLKLASAGADKTIRIWNVSWQSSLNIECSSTLTRHLKTVNVVRFSPTDQILASGGDDSFIILWEYDPSNSGEAMNEGDRESWKVFKILRGHMEDVHDIAWSSDGGKLLSGSIDNTAVLWDVKKGVKLHTLTEHKGFVQGVAFDPLLDFITTLSSDRSMRVYNAHNGSMVSEVKKMVMMGGKVCRLFHDDSMRSFFRRLAFSPDGHLLLVPSASFEGADDETMINSTLLFTRDSATKPLLYLPLPSGCRNSVAVRFSPVLYALRNIQHQQALINLPYRMIFAVATDNSLVLYDTQQTTPILCLTNIHYHTLNDVVWSRDGLMLVASSSDGYCTLMKFDEGELGHPYVKIPDEKITDNPV